jgi:hypothetical protein
MKFVSRNYVDERGEKLDLFFVLPDIDLLGGARIVI